MLSYFFLFFYKQSNFIKSAKRHNQSTHEGHKKTHEAYKKNTYYEKRKEKIKKIKKIENMKTIIGSHPVIKGFEQKGL
jgi:hypothetical protein